VSPKKIIVCFFEPLVEIAQRYTAVAVAVADADAVANYRDAKCLCKTHYLNASKWQ
jgi:hypothetical protein